MKKKAAAAFFLLFLVGCASTRTGGISNTEPPKELGIAAILKFEDVPVPAGFRLFQDQSFSFQNDSTRVGILKFAGRANAQRVIQFYREQMPLFQWDFVNLLESEKSLLNFEKADQMCTVTIEGGVTRTNLVVAVAPKASGFRSARESRAQGDVRKKLDKE